MTSSKITEMKTKIKRHTIKREIKYLTSKELASRQIAAIFINIGEKLRCRDVWYIYNLLTEYDKRDFCSYLYNELMLSNLAHKKRLRKALLQIIEKYDHYISINAIDIRLLKHYAKNFEIDGISETTAMFVRFIKFKQCRLIFGYYPISFSDYSQKIKEARETYFVKFAVTIYLALNGDVSIIPFTKKTTIKYKISNTITNKFISKNLNKLSSFFAHLH